jgi:wobble nucleotide-excising tRNase
MIRKFIGIENVGKFRACKPKGDVELRPITLVYAENGRGKTTLCDILRSLRTGDPDYVRGRTTLGPAATPTVDIRLEGTNARFDGTAWSTTLPELRIFDSLFVHENVYAGERVEHEQKRNLYRVIVGEKGVALASKVDELDSQVKAADSAIKAAKTPVAHFAPEGLDVDAYVALPGDADIDAKISAKEAELVALRRAEEIATKPLLAQLTGATLPTTLPTVLAKHLDDVSEEAEALVREHVEHHTSGATEPWLSTGLRFERDDKCPFCQQSTAGNDLVAAYRVYFGATYAALKEEVAELRKAVEAFGTEAARLRIEQTIQSNAELVEFWRQFAPIEAPELDADEFFASMEELRTLALAAVDQKSASILEATTLSAEFEAASVRFEAARQSASAYNATVTAANTLISEQKGKTGAGNLAQAEDALVLLIATKRRHETEPAQACQAYLDAKGEKKKLEEAKQAAKTELDEHSGDLLGTFQKRINELLEMVTAGFRLTNIAREYKGRSPRSHYQVLINDVAVELGDETTPHSQPAFRNTLSAGDRSTLALAFFLAQLELDPELDKKVVIFDDPFTSQDLSRRTWTQQRISRIGQQAQQVIVLSHEPYFLRLLYNAVPSANLKTLQFCRIGKEDTTITPWDILDATRGNYFQAHGVLTAFANDGAGAPRAVAQTVRPVLEGYFRFKFPGEFGDTEWLGDFIQKIRDAAPGSPLEPPKKVLEELEDINDYSKKYHHNTNPNADTEPITDGELLGFVKRTLELVGGF